MTNKFRENVKRSTAVRSAKEAKNGKCNTSEIVFMVLRSGKSNHFFSALKIGNLSRAGTESLWRKVWTTQKQAEFFPLLTRAVQTLPSGFFRGWRRVMACSLLHYTNSKISDILFHYSSSPDFLITRILDAVISWFTNIVIRKASEWSILYAPNNNMVHRAASQSTE